MLGLHAPTIARAVEPAQFVNIKVNHLPVPLLRRPFSVYRIEGETIEILFHVVGAGTELLAGVREGDMLDVLGPLGHPYGLDDAFDTAILVGGGLGVAPFPLTSEALEQRGKRIVTLLGARSASQLITGHLRALSCATDDGSAGFRGNVVDLLREVVRRDPPVRPKIFACGPNVMLAALQKAAAELAIPCEVSLESVMACGIGLCQGCPVELRGEERKYALICKEGTVFDAQRIVFA